MLAQCVPVNRKTSGPFSLVGTMGTVVQGASAAAVTPTFGTGESRTAGNLLVLWVTGKGAATLPAAPSGWFVAEQWPGSTTSSSIFFKTAAGSDANPTVAGVTSVNLSARVGEFSGFGSAPYFFRGSGANGATSAIVATNGLADTQTGALVVYGAAVSFSTALANTLGAGTLNNGSVAETNNNANTGGNHYAYGWGTTTSNSSADSLSYAFTTSGTTDVALAAATFL